MEKLRDYKYGLKGEKNIFLWKVRLHSYIYNLSNSTPQQKKKVKSTNYETDKVVHSSNPD